MIASWSLDNRSREGLDQGAVNSSKWPSIRSFHIRGILLASLLALIAIVAGLSHAAAPPTPGVLRTCGEWAPPPAYHGNPLAFGGVGSAHAYVFEPLFCHIPQGDTWLPRLGLTFEEKPKELLVHLRPNAFWHDGRPFTAEDVRATFLLLILRGHPIGEYAESIDVPNPTTIRFRWRYQTEDLKTMVLCEPIVFPASRFPGPIKVMEKFRALHLSREAQAPADMRAEMESARREILRFHPAFPIGTGPFRLKRLTTSEMLLEKFPQHPLAKALAFEQIRIYQLNSNEVGWALLLSGQIDYMAMACPIDLVKEIQKRVPTMKLAAPVDGNEFGFVINAKRWKDPVLRRALANVLDRDAIRELAYPYAKTTGDSGMGVVDSRRDLWLTPDQLAKFPKRDQGPKVAADTLKTAGYKQSSDHRWRSQDGTPIVLTITCRAGFSDVITMAEVAASQWEAFGIPVELRILQADIFPSKLSDGDFDIAATYGAMNGRAVTPVSGLERFFAPRAQLQQAMGLPSAVHLDGENVNTAQLIRQMRFSDNPALLRDNVYKLSRILYETAAYIPIYEKANMLFFNDGPVATNWPGTNDARWSGVLSGADPTWVNMMLFRPLKRGNP